MQSYNPNILIGSNLAVTLLNGCVSTPAEGEPHLFGVVMAKGYWLGKTLSEGHKKKISLAGKGRACSAETKQKLRETPNEGHFKKGHKRTPRIKLPISEIVDLYVNKKKCLQEIADMFNCKSSTIKRRLMESNVKIRSRGEANKNSIEQGRSKTLYNGHGPYWKGGRAKTGTGYVKLYLPNHPDSDKSGYIREHRFVMANKLGRRLETSEIVHHVNGIKDDNRPENLIIVKREKHYGEIMCPHCNHKFLIK